MKKNSFILILVVLSFCSNAQLTATIEVINDSTEVCQFSNEPVITLTASNGTPPYTFTLMGAQEEELIFSTGVESTISFTVPTDVPGTFVYSLVSVSDESESEMLNENMSIVIFELPFVDAGLDQTVCHNEEVTLCANTNGVNVFWNMGTSTNCSTILANFPTTVFTVMAVDINGCSNTDDVNITVLTPSEITAVVDSSMCTDGSIHLSVNFSETITILWEDGSTTPYLTNLSPGSYSAIIQDTTGCEIIVNYDVPASLSSSNCGTISGTVFYDVNEDCQQELGDISLGNRMVVANPGSHITFTNQNGYYEFHLDPGNYVIEAMNFNTPFHSICNPNYSLILDADELLENRNFANTIAEGIDFGVSCVVSPEIRPGFMFNFNLVINDYTGSSNIQNIPAWFILPDGVTMIDWPYPHTIISDTVYFNALSSSSNFNSVALFQTTSAWLGDTVTFCVGIDLPDSDLSNNIYCRSNVVIGAYDPNDKTTFLNGIPTNSTILLTDEILEYVIRFQNTGTADAINVYVLDTLKSTLDPSSFQLIATSHDCQVSILKNNVLKFDFPLIHLPDSTTNESESHGFIHYRVKQNSVNTVGDLITNTAHIYFDFNKAIITNTTHDLIVDETAGINDLNINELFELFPNPTQNVLNIKSKNSAGIIKQVAIYDMTGKNYYHQQLEMSSAQHNIEVETILSSGVYFIEVISGIGTIWIKFIKQ